MIATLWFSKKEREPQLKKESENITLNLENNGFRVFCTYIRLLVAYLFEIYMQWLWFYVYILFLNFKKSQVVYQSIPKIENLQLFFKWF